MISESDVDYEKTRLLLSHLNRAASKVHKKKEAKDKLHEQIQKLKKASKSTVYRKELKELEKRLSDVLLKENEIIIHQKARESSSMRIREKIDELEKKITAYLDSKKKRNERLKELEGRIDRRFRKEEKEVYLLEKQIMNIEQLYEKISSEKTHSHAQLERVKKKILNLRNRLGKLNKKQTKK